MRRLISKNACFTVFFCRYPDLIYKPGHLSWHSDQAMGWTTEEMFDSQRFWFPQRLLVVNTPGVKRPEGEADHSHLVPEFKNEWICAWNFPMRLHVVYKKNFILV
jgi:hypothetical protein